MKHQLVGLFVIAMVSALGCGKKKEKDKNANIPQPETNPAAEVELVFGKPLEFSLNTTNTFKPTGAFKLFEEGMEAETGAKSSLPHGDQRIYRLTVDREREAALTLSNIVTNCSHPEKLEPSAAVFIPESEDIRLVDLRPSGVHDLHLVAGKYTVELILRTNESCSFKANLCWSTRQDSISRLSTERDQC